MPICLDPSGTTFVYSLYVEAISLSPCGAHLKNREVVCRWSLKGLEDRSQSFTLRFEPQGWAGFCSFILVSFQLPVERNLCIRLSLSSSKVHGSLPMEDLAMAFLDLADLSSEERFKVDFLELRDAQLQVVAVAKLHSACQQRWSTEQLPLVPAKQASFLDYTGDAQARRLYEHIAAAAGIGAYSPAASAGAGRSAPRDPEAEGDQKRASGSPPRAQSREVTEAPARPILKSPEQCRNPAQTQPPGPTGAQSNGILEDFLGLLTLVGCAPERCAPRKCGCQFMEEAPGEAPAPRPEVFRPSPLAFREEPINFQVQPPTAASAEWLGHARRTARHGK